MLDVSLEMDDSTSSFGGGKNSWGMHRWGNASHKNRGKPKTLISMFDHFTRAELLDDGKKVWRCDGRCKRESVATKQLVCLAVATPLLCCCTVVCIVELVACSPVVVVCIHEILPGVC